MDAFNSRDSYIEVLMNALDRVDEVEASMSEGSKMTIPSWTYDDNIDDETEETTQAPINNSEVIDKLVMDTLEVVKELDEVDKTKYVKVFHANETTLAIQHTKVKVLAKERGVPTPKFLSQKKDYPSFVTLKTETFTKMTSSCSRGSSNTGPGFCTSILMSKLSAETKKMLSESLGLSNTELLLESQDVEEEEEDINFDPAASQDYPEYSQTQSTDTLKVCELCNFKTRSKLSFTRHVQEHPKCQVCKVQVSSL